MRENDSVRETERKGKRVYNTKTQNLKQQIHKCTAKIQLGGGAYLTN